MTTNAMFLSRAARRRIIFSLNNKNKKYAAAESKKVVYYSSILRTSPSSNNTQRTVTTLVQQQQQQQQYGWNMTTIINSSMFSNHQNNSHNNMEGSSFMRRSLSDKASSPEAEAAPKEEEKAEAETEEEEKAEAEEEEEETEEMRLEKRSEALEKEVQDLKNSLLRSLAEQENTRMIAKKDVESARQFAIKSFAKGLLDVSDNLERAMDAVPEDLRTTTTKEEDAEKVNQVLATLYEGIQMTEAGLSKAFQSNGLVKFGQSGDIFDPNKHNALFEFPDEKKEPGTVGQVIKNGFMLNSRVLRPAEVGVVKKS